MIRPTQSGAERPKRPDKTTPSQGLSGSTEAARDGMEELNEERASARRTSAHKTEDMERHRRGTYP